MNERLIQSKLKKFLGNGTFLRNCQVFHGFESDLIQITAAGYINEYEIKISYSDFRADFKKFTQYHIGEYELNNWGNKIKSYREGLKHDILLNGHSCNSFSYVAPIWLAEKILSEVPDSFGVYGIEGSRIIEYRKPKRIHKNKIDLQTSLRLLHNLAHKTFDK